MRKHALKNLQILISHCVKILIVMLIGNLDETLMDQIDTYKQIKENELIGQQMNDL